MSLEPCSYLLSEEDEPFEIFPGGCVCPAITAALRVLTASKVEFRAWQSVDDIRNAGGIEGCKNFMLCLWWLGKNPS